MERGEQKASLRTGRGFERENKRNRKASKKLKCNFKI